MHLLCSILRRPRWTVAAILVLFSATNTPLHGESQAPEQCDILIVGGGTGGVAAAMQACSMAEEYGISRIVLTEETDWLGGQYTSQGVSATDPNVWAGRNNYEAGASRLYYDFHDRIRDIYRPRALETARKTSRSGAPESIARQMDVERIQGDMFSPGNPWDYRMGFLPRDGVQVTEEMLQPYLESGLLAVHYNVVPNRTEVANNRIKTVTLTSDLGETIAFAPQLTIDATELGDLLPLAGIDYRVGIEATSETREPSLYTAAGEEAYPAPVPHCIQSFTYSFALEWGEPGSDHRLPWGERPPSYEFYKPIYTLSHFLMARSYEHAMVKAREKTGEDGLFPPWWTYRRIYDAANFDPSLPMDLYPLYRQGSWITKFSPETTPSFFRPNENQANVGDIIAVNFSSNDYTLRSIIDVSPSEREQAITEAKEQSLGYLFYLWYDVPRDPLNPAQDRQVEENRSIDPATGNNTGYANLIFRRDVMGTKDGFSKFPYIRESRRIRALFQVLQQHIMGDPQKRARPFHDSVGIGSYFYMDIHSCDEMREEKIDVVWKTIEFADGQMAKENTLSPFQIPFGALVPENFDGFIAGAKNIGVTHITNGSYRLQPVEFQIGQSAGAAAVLSLAWNWEPRDLWHDDINLASPEESEKRLRNYQQVLLKNDIPLFWNSDAGWDTEHFEAVQWVCLLGLMAPEGWYFRASDLLTRAEAEKAAAQLDALGFKNQPLARKITPHHPGPDSPLTRDEFEAILGKEISAGKESGGTAELTRGKAAELLFALLASQYGLKPTEK